MPRKLLILLLVIALLFELGLSFMAFFARETIARQLMITFNADTSFLAYLIAWLCLFVSLICGLALYQVVNRIPGYSTLCYLLGIWWVGIGLGIYFAFKRPDNLLTDTLKGSLLIVLTAWNSHNVKEGKSPLL